MTFGRRVLIGVGLGPCVGLLFAVPASGALSGTVSLPWILGGIAGGVVLGFVGAALSHLGFDARDLR